MVCHSCLGTRVSVVMAAAHAFASSVFVAWTWSGASWAMRACQ
jgi:hypothetical protein